MPYLTLPRSVYIFIYTHTPYNTTKILMVFVASTGVLILLVTEISGLSLQLTGRFQAPAGRRRRRVKSRNEAARLKKGIPMAPSTQCKTVHVQIWSHPGVDRI